MEPPQYLTDIFQKHGVRVILYPFDSFLFDENDPWQLAYYKLSALQNAVESLDYDNDLLLDADTVIQGTLAGVWADCKSDILLYPLAHGHNHPEMVSMRETSEKLYGNLYNMIHYGGEFIAGNQGNLKDFLCSCEVIYDDMVKKSIRTTQGDEFIISLAATQKRDDIHPATPYVRREWTGRYYDCSTAYRFTDIPILHLPAGKESTFSMLSAYYQRRGTFPEESIRLLLFA